MVAGGDTKMLELGNTWGLGAGLGIREYVQPFPVTTTVAVVFLQIVGVETEMLTVGVIYVVICIVLVYTQPVPSPITE